VVSDETAPAAWGQVRVQDRFSAALPALYFTPSYVETGAALDTTVSETVTLENRGLDAMTDVSLSMVTPAGDPAPFWAVLNSAADIGDIAVMHQFRHTSGSFGGFPVLASSSYFALISPNGSFCRISSRY